METGGTAVAEISTVPQYLPGTAAAGMLSESQIGRQVLVRLKSSDFAAPRRHLCPVQSDPGEKTGETFAAPQCLH
jgi:hypothetical protein